jgi:lysophospholipase L1-like esterase
MLLIITDFYMNFGQKYKYLALGDSYTVGESVDEDQRFPNQLLKKLSCNGISVSDPVIIAKTGWTTDELLAAINEKNINESFDLVTLLIGVNNQYRGREINEYREQFKALLDKAISFAGGDPGKVLVISIPDWGVTPFADGKDAYKIADEIDDFNEVNKQETLNRGAVYSFITDISRNAKDDESLVASDGLHPSGKMYSQWVDWFYEDAKKILTK